MVSADKSLKLAPHKGRRAGPLAEYHQPVAQVHQKNLRKGK